MENIVILEGSTNMGSCQCGDVDWEIRINTLTREYDFKNSNWSNSADELIPYTGYVKKLAKERGYDLTSYKKSDLYA